MFVRKYRVERCTAGRAHTAQVSVLVIAALLLGSCERWALDKQMTELCRKDGGLRVYQQMVVSHEELATLKRGLVNRGTFTDKIELPYRFDSETQVLVGEHADAQRGQGQLRRIREAIYRRSDGKLLAEEISYDRSGGDWITLGFQPSGNYCPAPRKGVFAATFVEKP